MDEAKRFYWIKLRTDFFEQDTIDFLLSQDKGGDYVVFYQKLCLITANNDGFLVKRIGNKIIPYDTEMLFRETRGWNKKFIEKALSQFKELGLIRYEKQEEGQLKGQNVLKIVGIEYMVGSESTSKSATQKREYRRKNDEKNYKKMEKNDEKCDIKKSEKNGSKNVKISSDNRGGEAKNEDKMSDQTRTKCPTKMGQNVRQKWDKMSDQTRTKCPTKMGQNVRPMSEKGHLTEGNDVPATTTRCEFSCKTSEISQESLKEKKEKKKESNTKKEVKEEKKTKEEKEKKYKRKEKEEKKEKNETFSLAQNLPNSRTSVASPRFVKPTLEEVQAYCLERNNSIDPEQFLDFYESKGWKVGSSPMKDWKAAVRTWERRTNNSFNGKSGVDGSIKNALQGTSQPQQGGSRSKVVCDTVCERIFALWHQILGSSTITSDENVRACQELVADIGEEGVEKLIVALRMRSEHNYLPREITSIKDFVTLNENKLLVQNFYNTNYKEWKRWQENAALGKERWEL